MIDEKIKKGLDSIGMWRQWLLSITQVKDREAVNWLCDLAVYGLLNEAPQVPAIATSGTEGENATIGEVAKQRPVDTPAVASPE